MHRKPNPLTVYLILQFSVRFLFSVIFTVNLLYHLTVVGLAPLQLVLVGTTLETTIFLFEIPTGVLADVKSRRLSVIIGYAIMGIGFIVEGSLPVFWAVLLAQALWGLGYTFTSGATQAWIADEVGEKQAGQAFLRGSQAGRVGALLGIPVSVLLGRVSVQVPIVLGGGTLIALAAFLALVMTEDGFRPTPPEDRTTWGIMLHTVADAQRLVRAQPVLLALLGIGLFYGLYSEGLDRLWTAHLLGNYGLPWADAVEPVVWFGIIEAVLMLAGLAATEGVRRHVDTNSQALLARVLMGSVALLVVALAGFGLGRSFWLALILYWLVGTLRGIAGTLHDTWLNLRIGDPQVRATLFSVSGQVDAIGQIAGGPALGAIGNLSIRVALVASALLLAPVVPLYGVAARQGRAATTRAPG